MNRRDFLKSNGLMVLSLATWGIMRKCYANTEIRIAPFKADATPPLGTPWYPSYKPLDKIEHPLLAKGIIIEDHQNRYVLCAIDWCEIINDSYYRLREMIANAVKTDPNAVFVQTVHQHTAPMSNNNIYEILAKIENPPPFPAKEAFEPSFENIVQAVEKAISLLEPCDTMEIGSAKVEKVASSRRILQPDGTCLTRFSSCKDPKLIEAPEGLIDPYLRTLSFKSTKGKPIARLHFYATHPQSFYGDTRASYDFPGMAREKMESDEGVPHIYFTGCAGDIAAGKYNDGTPQAREQLYQRMLSAMQSSVQSLQKDPVPKITLKTIPLIFGHRTEGEYSKENLEKNLNDTTKEPNYRIGSAMEIAWQSRADTIPIPISALHIGNVSILHLPGEPMIEFQLFAQKCTPNRTVLVGAYGDCGPSYICTEESFKQGGYEPSASGSPPSTEWKLKETIQQVLS
ncbi:MAG: hypothetical protein ACP5UA_00050 [Candidatus Hydrogenedens sp.]